MVKEVQSVEANASLRVLRRLMVSRSKNTHSKQIRAHTGLVSFILHTESAGVLVEWS